MPTFFRWLTYQQKRNDSVGYIARKIIKSKKEKPITSNYLDWFLCIREMNSQQLIEDLNEAWEEYKKYTK